MARGTKKSNQQTSSGRPSKAQVVSMLRDPAGWPSEKAPLRVRTGVMSNLTAQRQRESGAERVTLYRETGSSRRHPLQFSLRPPLAAAAGIAMIFSAANRFMGGVGAWQRWADGLANSYYDVPSQSSPGRTLAESRPQRPVNEVGRSEAEALFSDVLRFRAHMNGRIPVAEPQSEPRELRRPQPSQSPSRSTDDTQESSS